MYFLTRKSCSYSSTSFKFSHKYKFYRASYYHQTQILCVSYYHQTRILCASYYHQTRISCDLQMSSIPSFFFPPTHMNRFLQRDTWNLHSLYIFLKNLKKRWEDKISTDLYLSDFDEFSVSEERPFSFAATRLVFMGVWARFFSGNLDRSGIKEGSYVLGF